MNIDVARAYWVSLTHAEKLFFVAGNGNVATFAYNRLELHRAAARKQMTRIGEAIAESSRLARPEPASGATQDEMREYVRHGQLRMQSVLCEVHFYFVSWSGCRNMLQILVGQPEFLAAKKIFDGHLKHFEHYVAGRNSFEHFHDRLPGQRNAAKVKEVRPDPNAGAHRIYVGFSEGKYIHSDSSWDISPKSLELLENSIAEILTVVHSRIDEEFSRKGMA